MLEIEIKRRITMFLIFLIILSGMQIFTYYGKDFLISMAYVGNKSISELNLTSNRMNYLQDSFNHILEGDNNYYIWFSWISKNLIQVFLIMAVFFGFYDLIIDRRKGNIYFMLNNTSRKKYFIYKTLASIIYMFSILFISYLIGLVLLFRFNYNINIINFSLAHLQIFLTGFLLYTILINLSIILKKGKFVMLLPPLTIFLITIIFSNVIANKNQIYEFIVAKDIIIKNIVNIPLYFTFGILSIIFYFYSFYYFNRSDL